MQKIILVKALDCSSEEVNNFWSSFTRTIENFKDPTYVFVMIPETIDMVSLSKVINEDKLKDLIKG